MSGFKQFQKPKNQLVEPEHDSKMCAAYGCPLLGSVSPGSTGKYLCHCHAATDDAKEWGNVTSKIRAHDWMRGFASEIFHMDKGWQAFAHKFWLGQDEHMRPTPSEEAHKAHYIWRLMSELEYRVGAIQTRPQPIDRKPILPGRRVRVEGFVGAA